MANGGGGDHAGERDGWKGELCQRCQLASGTRTCSWMTSSSVSGSRMSNSSQCRTLGQGMPRVVCSRTTVHSGPERSFTLTRKSDRAGACWESFGRRRWTDCTGAGGGAGSASASARLDVVSPFTDDSPPAGAAVSRFPVVWAAASMAVALPMRGVWAVAPSAAMGLSALDVRVADGGAGSRLPDELTWTRLLLAVRESPDRGWRGVEHNDAA